MTQTTSTAELEPAPDERPRAVTDLRRVVVTGVAGFIGGHLAQRLVRAGALVIGVDRRDPKQDTGAAANLAGVLTAPNFVFAPADLISCSMDSLLWDADVVFHLAGVPGVRPSWGEEFTDYAASNVVATQRLMEAAVRLEIPRVVVASSSSVYGPTDGPAQETAAAAPLSPYGVTKLAAETLCLAYARRSDSATSVAALRYFTVYGPRQRADMLISRVLEAAAGGAPVCLFGAGDQRRDFTYVADAVAATVAAAVSSESGVFNVGGGRAASLAEVVHVAEDVTGARIPTSPVAARHGDVPATLADPTRARTKLGWSPQVDLVEGMRRHWQWMSSTDSTAAVS